ncbi:hypothetical protein [Acidipropionibacterium jensenii]|uniref:hypothetical protein n=1 Tax=Acidipropionibacterium jensenii TaxID=1749 RepID=UPI00214CF42A|nr:hypothetical protein [Acidipropionibacterium jensenii]
MAPVQNDPPAATIPDALWVGGMIRDALAGHGLDSHLEQADDLSTARVIDVHGTEWVLANLVNRLRAQRPRTRWPEAVEAHVDSMLASTSRPAPQSLDPEQLRSLLRCQLTPEAPNQRTDVSYGRRFATGVLEVLCLSNPESVLTLPRAVVEKLSIGIDEAFEQARANTDDEPVGELFRIDDSVLGITGESPFIASRAMNMARLSADIIGPAPQGISFAIPNRSLLLYTVMTVQGWRQQVTDLIQVCETVLTSDDFYHPGGLLCRDLFYWSPQGRIEPLGGPEIDAEGNRSLHIRPAEEFMRQMGLSGRH